MALNSHKKRRVLAKLVEAQKERCCYCRRPFTDKGEMRATIEHKRARMDGGTDCMSNLAAACHHCNQHRGRQMVRDRLSAKQPLKR